MLKAKILAVTNFAKPKIKHGFGDFLGLNQVLSQMHFSLRSNKNCTLDRCYVLKATRHFDVMESEFNDLKYAITQISATFARLQVRFILH